MTAPILLVPLDDRPVTSRLPIQIGAIAGIPVLAPPRELLGNLVHPADSQAIAEWLREEAPSAQALVLSLDTIAYGGLIPSRQSPDALETVQQRLASLVAIKQATPTLPIYGFSVTMRLSAQAAVEEEKPYWAEYGRAIYRHSFHQDRYEQHGDSADLETSLEAKGLIPFEVLSDYMDTRDRNFRINRMMIDWTRRNLFDVLLLTQDDTSRYGFGIREQRQLHADVTAAGLEHRVLLYPGCDEVASVLVARHLNRAARRTPSFLVRTSTPYGGTIVPLYEDRPLERTIASQVQAVGGRIVTAAPDADRILMVNTPSTAQGDLALRLQLDKVDAPARDLQPFVQQLRLDAGRVALADVAYANGADLALMNQFRDLTRLSAFAAWNTAGNTLGTVVAMASAGLDPARDDELLREVIRERIADDVLYQAMVRPQLQAMAADGSPIAELAWRVGPELTRLWQRLYPTDPVGEITASLPWHRLFEVDLRFASASEAADPVPSAEEPAQEPVADHDMMELAPDAEPA